jgi:hypothetical protein
MIGIYEDNFLEDLKYTFGSDKVKVTSSNIITCCPWCEYGEKKDHYHLYISLELPIFNCFHAGCKEGRGFIGKFIKKLVGFDNTSHYVDAKNLKTVLKRTNILKDPTIQKEFVLPPIDIKKFPLKDLYVRKRLKFSDIEARNIKGLIFDIKEFISTNKLDYPESPVNDFHFLRIIDFIQDNFIGFLTENHSKIMFRNADPTSSFNHYKLKLFNTPFLDYYKIRGGNPESNKVVVAEGIFNIFSEHIYDYLNIDNEVSLYASALSSKYGSLLKSIVFYEQKYRLDVVILSDHGIEIEYYKHLKKKNKHIINSLSVYYNKYGKDFNVTPVVPIKAL